jgi:hypothetical protein
MILEINVFKRPVKIPGKHTLGLESLKSSKQPTIFKCILLCRHILTILNLERAVWGACLGYFKELLFSPELFKFFDSLRFTLSLWQMLESINFIHKFTLENPSTIIGSSKQISFWYLIFLKICVILLKIGNLLIYFSHKTIVKMQSIMPYKKRVKRAKRAKLWGTSC